ncbi:MAG: outer membrane protein assembly factor BamD [Gemmatimonadaceae bacterium]|nr:outer membrane protein assembly factor BamD [Gemmatimonadaceae bacterium]MCW5825474.1 outer membrane protein assembly factor BamD [Gemmatimonadaceae bacterium]
MPRFRSTLFLLLVILAAGACFRSFNVRRYPTATALFAAGMERFEKKKYSDAVLAFERLTFDLPTRDTLLPIAHWYLGQSRRLSAERLLAAQSFNRLAEQFPNHELADDAMWMAGVSYRELWRRPSLDPQYGILAQAQFRLLQGVFPNSPFVDSTVIALEQLDEWFAAKDYETGMHYVRRKAYDSAIIYFRDVVTNYPNSDKARQAMLRLVEVYRLPALNYLEDAEEVCSALRAGFPTDADVLRICKMPTAATPAGGA